MFNSSSEKNPINMTLTYFRRRAFTLTELVVVIAITSVLMSLLFPALQRMRDRVRQVSCMNNLRQVGLAVLQYVNENDSYFPGPVYSRPLLSTSDAFVARMIPYLGTNLNIYKCASFTPDMVNYMAGRISYAMAISDPYNPMVHNHNVFGYLGNPGEVPTTLIVLQNGYSGKTVNNQITTRYDRDTWMMIDAAGDAGHGQLHTGGLNVLWCDSRVSWNPPGPYVTGVYPSWWQ